MASLNNCADSTCLCVLLAFLLQGTHVGKYCVVVDACSLDRLLGLKSMEQLFVMLRLVIICM